MKRPRGTRFRHLSAWEGTIWYRRKLRDRQVKARTGFPPTAAGWEKAIKWRAIYEAAKGIDEPLRYEGGMPTLAELATRYLAKQTSYLSTRERKAREMKFKPDGPILRLLGDMRLDEIGSSTLLQWYESEMQGKRKRQTAVHYVNALAALFKYARILEYVRRDPVADLRLHLSDQRRTKRGRSEAGSNVRPIESAAERARLLEAAKKDRRDWTYPIVLCLLDAGLRVGEVRGLAWGKVAWGDDDGAGRHLYIDQNIPSGITEAETTKSGRSRKVQLSRRLRSALLSWWFAQGQPWHEAFVFPNLDGDNFRAREWRRICGKSGAGIGARLMKDLRDTYASHLLSAGYPLGYVSKQLGHKSMQLTERHYARWIPDGDVYEPRVRLAPGDVPADVLAQLEIGNRCPESCPEADFDTSTGQQEVS